jgi:hypothetical protein
VRITCCKASAAGCVCRHDAVSQFGRIGVARHARRHALRALEDAARTGKTVLSQVGRCQAVRGRGGCVQLLRVRSIAQEFPQARRLRAGRAEGMQHLVGCELEQVPRRSGSRQRAGRARRMKDAVVRAAEKFADADAHLVAGHGRRQQVAPAGADRLGNCQCCRKHDRTGMEDRAVVHVILFRDVRGSRVDHCREQRRSGAARDQHLAGPAARPHGLRVAVDGLHSA